MLREIMNSYDYFDDEENKDGMPMDRYIIWDMINSPLFDDVWWKNTYINQKDPIKAARIKAAYTALFHPMNGIFDTGFFSKNYLTEFEVSVIRNFIKIYNKYSKDLPELAKVMRPIIQEINHYFSVVKMNEGE